VCDSVCVVVCYRKCMGVWSGLWIFSCVWPVWLSCVSQEFWREKKTSSSGIDFSHSKHVKCLLPIRWPCLYWPFLHGCWPLRLLSVPSWTNNRPSSTSFKMIPISQKYVYVSSISISWDNRTRQLPSGPLEIRFQFHLTGVIHPALPCVHIKCRVIESIMLLKVFPLPNAMGWKKRDTCE